MKRNISTRRSYLANKKLQKLQKRYARRGYRPAEKERVDTLKSEYVEIITAKKDIYMRRLGSEVSDP